ncbi:hypothetical protein RUND412_010642 [Rhizina undulata]
MRKRTSWNERAAASASNDLNPAGREVESDEEKGTAGPESTDPEFIDIDKTLRLNGILMTVTGTMNAIESVLHELSSEVTRFSNSASGLSMHSYEVLATDVIKSCMDWTPVLQLLRLDEIIREIKPIKEIVCNVEVGVKLLDKGKLIKEWQYIQYEETFGILVWVWRHLLITLLVNGKGIGETEDKVKALLHKIRDVLWPSIDFNLITREIKLSPWDIFLEGGQVNRSSMALSDYSLMSA